MSLSTGFQKCAARERLPSLSESLNPKAPSIQIIPTLGFKRALGWTGKNPKLEAFHPRIELSGWSAELLVSGCSVARDWRASCRDP